MRVAVPHPVRHRSRAVLATLCLALHLAALVAFAHARFGQPWNRAPDQPPAFATPTAQAPARWNRLVASRWDAQHYVNLALRGYDRCPTQTRRTGALPAPPTMLCDLAYYPGYALAGRIASLGGRVPVDYALLLVSLASSWIFFFLWTGPEIVGALGLRATLVALACFNLFTTGFTVATVQTEPLLLAASLGAFVLAQRGRLVPAAIAAGLATGVRVSGGAVGLAMVAFVAVDAWRSRPLRPSDWAVRAAACALSFWGLAAMLAYDGVALHDPLIYFHAHEASFGHAPKLTALLVPDTRWLLASLVSQLHEGVVLAAALVWLGLGIVEAAKGFTPPARAYWYALTAGVLGVSMLGTVSRSFIGMNRYLLVAIPLFFAMGKLLERRRLALAVWLVLSAWHYWNVDLCFYVGDQGEETVRRCHGLVCSGG
jgi:hypothetical protein